MFVIGSDFCFVQPNRREEMAIAIKTAIPLRLVKLFTLLWELLRDSGTPVHQSRNVQRAFLLFYSLLHKGTIR